MAKEINDGARSEQSEFDEEHSVSNPNSSLALDSCLAVPDVFMIGSIVDEPRLT